MRLQVVSDFGERSTSEQNTRRHARLRGHATRRERPVSRVHVHFARSFVSRKNDIFFCLKSNVNFNLISHGFFIQFFEFKDLRVLHVNCFSASSPFFSLPCFPSAEFTIFRKNSPKSCFSEPERHQPH